MIREITPRSPSAYTSLKWRTSRTVYSIALIASAMAVGAIAGFIGVAIRLHLRTGLLWPSLIAVLATAYGMRELGVLSLPMPQITWQVPAHWSRYGKVVQSLLYGAVLGADVFTLIPYATFYLILLFEASQGPMRGVALGMMYGTARALSTLVAIRASVEQHRNSNVVARAIARTQYLFHPLNGVALLSAGGVLLITLIVAH